MYTTMPYSKLVEQYKTIVHKNITTLYNIVII